MWKEKMKSAMAGLLVGMILTGSVAYAATTTLSNVSTGVKIVVDGQELTATDAHGNRVEPFLYKGTTYLPVRAIATAVGMPVHWDGASHTVYLGKRDETPQSPTMMMTDLPSLADKPKETTFLKDNRGNQYASAIYNWESYGDGRCEYQLNGKYSRFKATVYVPEGECAGKGIHLTISADDEVIYTSPDLTGASGPVAIDVDISGCNRFALSWSQSFRITQPGALYDMRCLADACFYQ